MSEIVLEVDLLAIHAVRVATAMEVQEVVVDQIRGGTWIQKLTELSSLIREGVANQDPPQSSRYVVRGEVDPYVNDRFFRTTLLGILSLIWRSFVSTLVCQSGWCLVEAGAQLWPCPMHRNILTESRLCSYGASLPSEG